MPLISRVYEAVTLAAGHITHYRRQSATTMIAARFGTPRMTRRAPIRFSLWYTAP